MSHTKSWSISLIFIALDAIVIYGVFRLATILREIISPVLGRPPLPWGAVNDVAQLGIFLILGMFFIQGLYPGYGLPATHRTPEGHTALAHGASVGTMSHSATLRG